jgi:S1-C subfamily serine protease
MCSAQLEIAMLVNCSRLFARHPAAAPCRRWRARLAPRRAFAAGRGWLVGLALLLAAAVPVGTADANPLDAVLGLRAEVPSDARTARTLGRVRQGSAVVIDNAGLALTIGYLVLEASEVSLYDAAGRTIPADVVAYDHETGFGLVRALLPLDVTPLPIAGDLDIQTGDPLLVVSRAGRLEGTQVALADRRVFAGYWEYLLDAALFTTPGHGQFGGAALIDPDGRLVGIGSLRVGDAGGDGRPTPGNMFVPVDLVPPILGDMLAMGHAGHAKPWLGITSREGPEGVILGGVSAGGPAAEAGLRPGDRVVAVGEAPVGNLESLYRSVWQLGEPGVEVPITVERGDQTLDVKIRSIDRREWLRLDQSF